MSSQKAWVTTVMFVVVAVGLGGCQKPRVALSKSKFAGSMQQFKETVDAALASLNLKVQWGSHGSGSSGGGGFQEMKTNQDFRGSFTIGKDQISATQPSKETVTALIDAIIKECQVKLKDAGLKEKNIEKTTQPGGDGPRIIIRYTGEGTTGRVKIDVTAGKETHIRMELEETVVE